MKLMVIHGPNLNLLGVREPGVYGKDSYDTLTAGIAAYAEKQGAEVEFVQTNHEGGIVDAIHRAYFEHFDGILLNPGAYTHYSYAIFDAVKSVPLPCVEIHLSNVHAREEFRRTSVVAPACIGQIAGFGAFGYRMAIDALIDRLGGGRHA